ncbi:M23 family metallopeptidase [uncultured Clostridium sp.]|uniref:M23 family metallopeptidase n=1 Tax=uncultured Clostridium sp. TaxID=59620 RepID=UPI0026F2123C|nr:peptidoglycan DD-metalloendopeptidase family protein [uncultured Clostridium sp.]
MDKWSVYYGHCIEGSNQQYGITSSGTQVKAGQPLIQGNSTGASTGNHLHYELRRNGSKVNPLPYMGLGNAHWPLPKGYLED